MTIDELYQIKVNKAVAYIVGLIFPLYKNVMFDGKDCMAGNSIVVNCLTEIFKNLKEIIENV